MALAENQFTESLDADTRSQPTMDHPTSFISLWQISTNVKQRNIKYQIFLCWRLLLKPRAGCRVLSFTQKSFFEGTALQTNEDYYLRRIDNNKTQSSQFLAQILVRPRRSGTMSKLRRSIIFPSVQFLHRQPQHPALLCPAWMQFSMGADGEVCWLEASFISPVLWLPNGSIQT